MTVTVDKGIFRGRDQAIELIHALGRVSRDGAMETGDIEDVHWHKTSLKIYVLAGSFETNDVSTDQLLFAGAGDLITIPARTLHAARCPQPATYVVGFESAEAMAKFGPENPADI